jgi:chromosome segregation ATPase
MQAEEAEAKTRRLQEALEARRLEIEKLEQEAMKRMEEADQRVTVTTDAEDSINAKREELEEMGRQLDDLASELSVRENDIKVMSSLRSSVRYLIIRCRRGNFKSRGRRRISSNHSKRPRMNWSNQNGRMREDPKNWILVRRLNLSTAKN